jgi:hypothetical protein
MYRLLLIGILGVWLQSAATAQTYFNKRETLRSGGVVLQSVLQKGDRYYTFANCVDSVNSLGGGWFNNILGLRLSVWNRNGDLLIDSLYQQQDSTSIEVVNNAMQELSDGSILLPCNGYDITGSPRLLLFCYDSNAHLLWQRAYNKPSGYPAISNFNQFLLKDFKPDGYGHYLMLSDIVTSYSMSQGFHKMLLTKLDSGFNEIWHKDFGSGIYNTSADKLIVEPGGYTLGGCFNNYSSGGAGFTARVELFRTDTSGSTLWHWVSPDTALTLGPKDLVRTKDGGYVFCGVGDGYEEVSQGGVGYPYYYSWIEKTDSTGEKLWSYHLPTFATNTEYNGFSKLIELPDGSIMASGMMTKIFDSTGNWGAVYGVIGKFRTNGKLESLRLYQFDGDTTLGYVINDMKRTSDGGYIMAGEADAFLYKDSTTMPWQRAWLLKVDSNGCMSATDPQCHPLSVANTPVATVYSVYPNPVTEQLHISINGQAAGKEMLVLCDITGRAVLQTPLERSHTAIDVKALQPGMYLYRIMRQGGTLAAWGKVLKQ